MSQFTVRGTFQAREGDRPFETTVDAPNENVAREHTFATFGSQHGLKRTQMTVTEVEAQ
ncbi:50S ribosomal protein L18Ae [Haloarchaeobius iranensis]|uniref:Large ribosomal subunit protein eL20 n=1 Tax=Haloarchaeobius iranensis TaxID=996166 RepID=A0A1G9VJV8_9EURY|nr:50S ribosomal protein L18Ae [Haloarchaeobius iranensis]SDM72353.1 large subunit ribosomal protein LX [Haloarchaeobius iranensis]